MPLLETKGAASSQGFGEFTASTPAVYIEDVFSTYLYTGNGSTQTITNGIDLSTKGGLVWTKCRDVAPSSYVLIDSARGPNVFLATNNTGPDGTEVGFTFNTNGFKLGTSNNSSSLLFASWTFRKQAKFFDIVTYTGDGTSNRQIAHLLGSTPGCVIIKETSGAKNWGVWHRSFSSVGDHMYLNTNGAVVNNTVSFGSNLPTSSVFNVGAFLNSNGATYVAYLFAHDAGGFGLSGTDNVISCGSYTGNGSSGQNITLNWETQFVMIKRTDSTGNWKMYDAMRGMQVEPNNSAVGNPQLQANTSNAEVVTASPYPIASGFNTGPNDNVSSATYIYIAIRRGPMKVPTSGTSVFSPNTSSSPGGTVITTGFPLDAQLTALRAGGYNNVLLDRLRGIVTIPYGTPGYSAYLATNTTGAEASYNSYSAGVNNTGFQIANTWADLSSIYYSFRRAPGFFDVVCYTGTGVARTINHNLGVAPELIIVKARAGDYSARGWATYLGPLFSGGVEKDAFLNTTAASSSDGLFNNTQPTASVFSVSTDGYVNGPVLSVATTYVAYLFATVAGVSKVGSYTGTGTTKQIDCGFTGGARFILIKRTDSTGDWYVYDTARGIVSGNDPYLFLNSTAAEVTNTDYIDPYSAGFELSSTAPAGLNANGGTFVFFAVA